MIVLLLVLVMNASVSNSIKLIVIIIMIMVLSLLVIFSSWVRLSPLFLVVLLLLSALPHSSDPYFVLI